MGFKVGIPVMKCSLNPSTQTNSRTGKAAKTCGVGSAWREMNDERLGRDTTIDRSLTKNNIWMEGSTSDNVENMVKGEIERINSDRRDHGIRALRKDAVSVIEIIEKPPIDYMQGLSYQEKAQFLSDSHDVMKGLLEEWNPNWQVIESVQHHDEFGGLSAHNHTLVMLSSEDKNGVATMNAKSECNLKFFNFINNNYADRMRELGYDVENCKTYDRMSEEEKEERRLHPEEHGVEAYKFKQAKQEEMKQQLQELSNSVEEKKEELQHVEQKMSNIEKKELSVNEREKTLAENQQKLSEAVSKASERITSAWEKIGDLQDEKAALEENNRKAVEAKERYEQKVLEVTQAPDIPTYNEVVAENRSLKEELSLKDRIIESLRETNEKLQETAQHWKDQANEWKDRFSDITHKAGEKLMGFFGYDVSQEKDVSPLPSAEVSEGFKSLQSDVKEIDLKSLRTIPDNEEEGKFRVVQRTDDGYETVKGGFDTRHDAESWQKDLASGVRSLDDTLEEGRGLRRQ